MDGKNFSKVGMALSVGPEMVKKPIAQDIARTIVNSTDNIVDKLCRQRRRNTAASKIK